MVTSCCVINCTNRFDKNNPKSFFRIPKKPEERRKLWIRAINRICMDGCTPWEPAEHDRVCYRHFITGEKSNDKNSPDYVPSINLGYKDTKLRADLRLARHQRLKLRESKKLKKQAASALLDLSNTERFTETRTDVICIDFRERLMPQPVARATFHCKPPVGQPEPKVLYHHNSERLQLGRTIPTPENKDMVMVMVLDAGKYSCVAVSQGAEKRSPPAASAVLESPPCAEIGQNSLHTSTNNILVESK